MIHYGTLISNGKSERPGGIKSGASGDLAISKEFKVFMFAALVDFIFLIQTGSFWVEQNNIYGTDSVLYMAFGFIIL